MADLHLVVCMKVVPKSEEIRVDRETMRLEREDARSEINPPDMNALEMALRLRDEHGGRVSILSMGPPLFAPVLRVGLAMGADDIFLMSDRRFGGADTLATTYTLAHGIRKLADVDLILCGEESADGATGQVPSGLAEWLDLPQITLATQMEINPRSRTVKGRRGVKGGYEILKAPLPALVSVKTACNEPRFMLYERKQWAFEEAEITIWDAESVDVEGDKIGVPGSPTIVSGLDQAAMRERRRQFLEGTAEEAARQLAAKLCQAL
jgi:electron transfer flavoprotein beta subunit